MQKLGVADAVREAVVNHVSGASKKGVAGVYNVYEFAPEKRAALERWAARVERIVNPPADNVQELRAG